MAGIKIGDKEYTEEQLKAALESSTKLSELERQIAPVQQMIERYKLEGVEDLLQNTEGAFTQILQLQEAGLIDEKGQIKEKPPEKPPVTPKVPPVDPTKDKNSVEAIVAKVMEGIKPTVDKMEKQLNFLNDSQSQLLRERTLSKVQERYPNLKEKEVSVAIAKANAQKRDFWDVAKEISKEKEAEGQQLISAFAEEHKLDLKELNNLKEMRSNEGSVAEAVVEGKKISFKKGDNSITPREATENFFKLQDKL